MTSSGFSAKQGTKQGENNLRVTHKNITKINAVNSDKAKGMYAV